MQTLIMNILLIIRHMRIMLSAVVRLICTIRVLFGLPGHLELHVGDLLDHVLHAVVDRVPAHLLLASVADKCIYIYIYIYKCYYLLIYY